MIDITMTATRRQELIMKTLDSFKEKMFRDVSCRLIINIDPVGPDNTAMILESIRSIYNPWCYSPPEPSFSKAFKWVWSRAKSKYVFHLEDDWELLVSVDIRKMIEIMEANPDLAVLRLPWKPTGPDKMKNWKYFFPWNGQFFECPEDLKRTVGFCGHPSLIRGGFVRNTVRYLDDEKNPEKQFHHGHPELMKEVDRWRYGVFAKPNQPAAIRDIGRRWMAENGHKKAGSKAWFTEWEKAIPNP